MFYFQNSIVSYRKHYKTENWAQIGIVILQIFPMEFSLDSIYWRIGFKFLNLGFFYGSITKTIP